MKRSVLLLLLMCVWLCGCSSITMLRTSEIQEINDEVREDLTQKIDESDAFVIDSLRKQNEALEAKLAAQEQLLNRMKADLSILAARVADESVRNDSRQEEIMYRLDMLIGKSDKILAKKVVVSGAPAAPISADSVEAQAMLLAEMEAMYNTARADYSRGEYKIAFDGFKQVYEQMKTDEMAEESLYYMALCLMEVEQNEKAKILLNRLVSEFPEGKKLCTTTFKLAGLAVAEGDVATQKKHLQALLEKKQCMETNEFVQAAEMLEEILNGETSEPKPAEPSEPEAKALPGDGGNEPAEVKAEGPKQEEAKPAEEAPKQAEKPAGEEAGKAQMEPAKAE